jgi:hypothetical protein
VAPGVSGLVHASAACALFPDVVNVGAPVRALTSHGKREARFCTSRWHSGSATGGVPTVDSQHQTSRVSVLGLFQGNVCAPRSG